MTPFQTQMTKPPAGAPGYKYFKPGGQQWDIPGDAEARAARPAPIAPAGMKFNNPNFLSAGMSAVGTPPNSPPAGGLLGALKAPMANAVSFGGKALPGTPMPPNPYSGPNAPPSNVFNADTAPMGYMSPKPGAPMATPLSPLKVAGTRTLQDAGTVQHMGAGSIVGAGGTPKWWDGTQPSNVMPATMSPNLDAWKAKNMSESVVREKLANRQAGPSTFVSTGGQPGLLGALKAGPQAGVAAPMSPFFQGTGLAAPKGPSAAFNNYRTSEMMKKQAGILGSDGLQGAIGMGGAMLQNGANNQHQMAMLQQQQAMQLHPADQAHVNLLTSVLGNENLDPATRAGVYGEASNILQGMRRGGTQQVPNSPLLPPGYNPNSGQPRAFTQQDADTVNRGLAPIVNGQGQGSVAGSAQPQSRLEQILSKPAATKLPEGIASMPVDQQFNHVRQFDAANPNLPPAERTRQLQKAGVDEQAINTHAMGILRPGMLGTFGNWLGGLTRSPAEESNQQRQRSYAEKMLKGTEKPQKAWWELRPGGAYGSIVH